MLNTNQVMRQTPPEEGKRKPRRKYGVLLLALVLILVTFGAYQLFAGATANINYEADDDTEQILARLSELVVLPEGEIPTIATVTDPTALDDQEFFANAEIGFKVIIYGGAKKAILYDPERHLIVEVAPIILEN